MVFTAAFFLLLGDSDKSYVAAVGGGRFGADDDPRLDVTFECCRSRLRTLLSSSSSPSSSLSSSSSSSSSSLVLLFFVLPVAEGCWFRTKSVCWPTASAAASASRGGGTDADAVRSCARLRSLIRACDME